MCGSRNFCQGGGGGRGGGRPDCQKTALITFLCLVLNLFYSFTVVYKWFISKRTIILQGFREGPTFSRGSNIPQRVQLFPGLFGDQRAVGSSLTGVTALWSLRKTHLS